MSYDPITSFRRPVEAVQLTRRLTSMPKPSAPDQSEAGVDKWQILRELTTARASYGLNDRALAVLQALLSFHPERVLQKGDLIVFPSNRSICERLNGMACSTMRRHLTALLDSGLIQRRDSPNGKRFVRHDRAGSEAFGFDLSPLLDRHAEIRDAAETALAAQEALHRQRRTVSLMRRDLAALAEFGARTVPNAADWTELAETANRAARNLRRRNDAVALEHLETDLADALQTAKIALEPETRDLSTNVRETEHHCHISRNNTFDSNINLFDKVDPHSQDKQRIRRNTILSTPLPYVLSTCKELRSLTPDVIDSWPDFIRSVHAIRPMLGISDSAWIESVDAMGTDAASITVAGMLERYSEIRSPGAYLRTLSRKAIEGRFSPVTMLATLARTREENLTDTV